MNKTQSWILTGGVIGIFLMILLFGGSRPAGLPIGSIDYNNLGTITLTTSTASTTIQTALADLRNYKYVYIANTGATNAATLVINSTTTGATAGKGIYLAINGGNYVIKNNNQWGNNLNAYVITESGTTSIAVVAGK